tara:strand:+ start:6664 stop:7371 length:708 start_codon:yes stop_codon:yes gene_type:complete
MVDKKIHTSLDDKIESYEVYEVEIGEHEIICYDLVGSHTTSGVRHTIIQNDFKFDEIDIGEGENYVELGAFNGLLAFYVAKLFPKANIHIFECNPIMLTAINFGIVANNLWNVRCYPFGLSSFNGNCNFLVQEHNVGGSYLTHDKEVGGTQKVKVYDFETILSTFDNIKYLKIDIEAEEYKIFDTLIKSESKFFDRVSCLHLELHEALGGSKTESDNIKEYLSSFSDLKAIIETH